MSERFAQYDGGKGPEDRSDVNKRADCPLWKVVKLDSGVQLTPNEASLALSEAEGIILDLLIASDNELTGLREGREWLNQYFNLNNEN